MIRKHFDDFVTFLLYFVLQYDWWMGKQAVLRQNLSDTISNPRAVVDFTQNYLTYKFFNQVYAI